MTNTDLDLSTCGDCTNGYLIDQTYGNNRSDNITVQRCDAGHLRRFDPVVRWREGGEWRAAAELGYDKVHVRVEHLNIGCLVDHGVRSSSAPFWSL